MNKIEKIANAISVLQELLRYEDDEENSHVFYEAHNSLVKVLTKEKEKQDLHVYQVDYKGKFLTTVRAKTIEQAYEKARKLYPNVPSSLQVWELGSSQKQKKGIRNY